MMITVYVTIKMYPLEKKIQTLWDKRRPLLEQEYAITGWSLFVISEVCADIEACHTSHHCNVIAIVFHLFHEPPCANKSPLFANLSVDEIVDKFWMNSKHSGTSAPALIVQVGGPLVMFFKENATPGMKSACNPTL